MGAWFYIGPRLQQLVPGIDGSAVRLVTEMPRETFCMVLAFARDGSAAYTEAALDSFRPSAYGALYHKASGA